MVELNGSELVLNATNKTTYNPYACTDSSFDKIYQVSTISFLIISSLVGNSLIPVVFYRNKALRTPVHYFIVNMAVSDLIFGGILLPWFVSGSINDNRWLVDGVLGSGLCKLLWFTFTGPTVVSISNMIVLAFDRFRAVVFPLKPALISRKGCRTIIIATWIASMISGAGSIYALKLVSHGTKLYCVFFWNNESDTTRAMIIIGFSFVSLIVLSAIVLAVLYTAIIISLYRQKKRLRLASEIVKKRTKTNRKITCMLVIVVIVFYAVWIPFSIQNTITIFTEPSFRLQCPHFIWALPFSYATINPIVYYIFNKNYRNGFKELLCSLWLCNNKCENCFQSSVKDQNVRNAGQVNEGIENNELQGERKWRLMVRSWLNIQ